MPGESGAPPASARRRDQILVVPGYRRLQLVTRYYLSIAQVNHIFLNGLSQSYHSDIHNLREKYGEKWELKSSILFPFA